MKLEKDAGGNGSAEIKREKLLYIDIYVVHTYRVKKSLQLDPRGKKSREIKFGEQREADLRYYPEPKGEGKGQGLGKMRSIRGRYAAESRFGFAAMCEDMREIKRERERKKESEREATELR